MSHEVDHEQRFRELVQRTEGLQPWRRVFHATGGAAAAWIVYVSAAHGHGLARPDQWDVGAAIFIAVLSGIGAFRAFTKR